LELSNRVAGDALVSPNRNDVIWNESITPVDPVELQIPNTSLNDALTAALENRPELELNQVQKDINSIDEKFYKDQTKPQIDLIAGYTSTGVGGEQSRAFRPVFQTPCQVDPNSPACQAQQAALAELTGNPYSGIFSNKYPTYSVGVQFNLPLFGDKTAKAQLGRARVEGERLGTQREQIEQQIQVEVRNSIQLVRTAEARLRAAAIARENTAINRVTNQISVHEMQPGNLAGQSFDVVVANLTAEVLVDLMEKLAACMKPVGWIIVSGILNELSNDVERSAREAELEIIERQHSGEWTALVARRL